MLEKNEEYIVEIIDNGFQGEGIAKIDGQIVFIPNTLKGEKVKIKILKVTSKLAYGKVINILKKSEHRIKSDCEIYEKCGGCNLRHIDYDYSMEIKKLSVENTLKKALGRDIKIDEVIKMENPYFYRNKLQCPVGQNKDGETVMGIFAERSHRIVETGECKLQNKLAQSIANDILDFAKKNQIIGYDEQSLTGILRHIVIRVGIKTDEVMVTLVVNDFNFPNENKMVDFLTNKYKQIKTIIKNLNNKNTNVILGQKNQVIYGNGYITDILLGKKFYISNFSFYQVNPVQTEKLYNKAIEYAGLTGKETAFDLYCGIGTIGICASDNIRKLFGIEVVPEAIEDAKKNAELNNVNNSEFLVGNVEEILPEFKDKADVVFLDPPRKGCDKKVLETLMKTEPQKIVYISCNPATFGRDLKILEEKYEIKKFAIYDMFAWTRAC